jgi:hypothetical protein
MHRRFLAAGAVVISLLLSAAAQSGEGGRDDSVRPLSDLPRLIDPGFESFSLAGGPAAGWYSDDVRYADDPGFGGVSMRQDDRFKVEGQYSLRIGQIRPRAPRQGQACLSQSVRLPKRGGATRRFDLAVQTRGGMGGPLSIHVYVWDGNMARVIARRDVKVKREWQKTTLNFKVPDGYERFGIWFYLPRDDEAQVWLDDVRLTPRLKWPDGLEIASPGL